VPKERRNGESAESITLEYHYLIFYYPGGGERENFIDG
jgi:hypothetical protein